jgi:cytochrome c oxidase subunit I+III
MFITMMADLTAFGGLMFGYFFYWTIHAQFPPNGPGLDGPGVTWPMIALASMLAGWGLTIVARELNARGHVQLTRAALASGMLATAAGGAAALIGPWVHGLDPVLHVYPAIVWTIAIWMAVHAAVGLTMQAYVIVRSGAGRLTATHDGDLRNITVYQHFLAFSALVAFVTLAWFPELP